MEDNFQCETKTKDNVFVTIAVSVQYQVIYDAVYAAFYTLEYPQAQIEAYVMDSIRTSLCTLTLDESFINKDKISHNMKLHLEDVMSRYGFRILNALITDMSPDQRVRAAMNEINSSKRMREAAAQTAEGNKTIVVKKAEATAEGMYLQGVGTARQRKAIMDGLRESIVEFSSDVRDTSPKDVMDLLVLSQYFDTLRELGNAAETRTVYLSAEAEGGATMRSSLLQANAASL
jgi:regulator of protease activity HflC (stomatin/prohibitin superfamily)